MERVINSLNQDLPPTKEWYEFWMNYENIRDKAVIVSQVCECFFIEHGNDCVCFAVLDSQHREADQKIPMHAAFVGRKNNDTVCVVADDMDIYLSQINISLIFVLTSISRSSKKPRTRME